MKKVLTDIMGTTTHNKFIGELLEHFREHGSDYIAKASPQALEIIDKIKEETDLATGEQVISYVAQQLSDHNLRPEYLVLTGMANKEGYEQGRLRAPFFEDVPRKLKDWKQNDKGIFIYSNGSADEQELIFRHTNQGDLTGLVDGYFGTDGFGNKYEPESYKRISEDLETEPREIAFLSDVKRELDAADKAGYRVILVERPGNKPVESNDYEKVRSFDEINL